MNASLIKSEDNSDNDSQTTIDISQRNLNVFLEQDQIDVLQNLILKNMLKIKKFELEKFLKRKELKENSFKIYKC